MAGLPERVALGRGLARPGLERETRRLVAISILVALGRHEELELHLRAALRAGLSTTMLREVLLQTAVYAGVPAANSAFAIANRVWAEVRGRTGRGLGRRCGFGARLLLLGALRDSGRVSCRFSTSDDAQKRKARPEGHISDIEESLISRGAREHPQSAQKGRRALRDRKRPITFPLTEVPPPAQATTERTRLQPRRLGRSRRPYSTVTSVPIGSMPKTT